MRRRRTWIVRRRIITTMRREMTRGWIMRMQMKMTMKVPWTASKRVL